AIVACAVVSELNAAGTARHAEPSFRATTETALESLPLAVRWPAAAYLSTGDPDLLGNIEEAAKLTASGHEPVLKAGQGVPDTSLVVARLDEPGQGVSANFNAALGMHALIHRLAPYLATNEEAARKFALADAAAMRRLPLAQQ